MPSRPRSQPADAAPENEAGKGRLPVPEELFKTVSSHRVSQVIVEQIRVLLRDGRLKPGDRLPSERELCVHFGVSRVTVREALRILEAGGLVEIRVGARGGAFVTSPTSSRVGEGLAALLSLSPLTAAEVTEARLVFELGIVPLIVERATEEDLEALRAMCDEHAAALKDGEYTMEMSAAFHARVAACTHNAAIEMLVQSFHGPLLMSLLQAQTVAPLMGRRGSGEHREFVEAVAARDVEAATATMRQHLERTASRVKDGKGGEGDPAALGATEAEAAAPAAPAGTAKAAGTARTAKTAKAAGTARTAKTAKAAGTAKGGTAGQSGRTARSGRTAKAAGTGGDGSGAA